VRVLLEDSPKGDIWVAEAFERKAAPKKGR
jgi:hypothetical protein